jgi:hypothetical protein
VADNAIRLVTLVSGKAFAADERQRMARNSRSGEKGFWSGKKGGNRPQATFSGAGRLFSVPMPQNTLWQVIADRVLFSKSLATHPPLDAVSGKRIARSDVGRIVVMV